MKIGILSFQNADNYGGVLQCYALLEYLKKLYPLDDVSILNYSNKRIERSYSPNPFKAHSIKGFISKATRFPFLIQLHRKFNRFRRDYLFVSKTKITTIPASYDYYIVGSDQVWNLKITGNDGAFFFEHINQKNRLLSYAASANDAVGSRDEEIKRINQIKKFGLVSVREKALKDTLFSFGINAQLVCDPVFLMTRDFWDELSTKSSIKMNGKYVFVYALEYSQNIEKMIDLALANGLKVYLAHPTGRRLFKKGKMINCLGPIDFIRAIKNADCIIGNSFHLFAFSILFGKEIYFEYIDGLMNRVKNLLNVFKIEIVQTEACNLFKANNKNIINTEAYINFVNESKDFLLFEDKV